MDYERMIHGLLDRSLVLLQTDPGAFDQWQFQTLPEWSTALLPDLAPEEFITFVRDNKEYSFVYYDAFGKVCGKPAEVAVYVLTELIKELVEEKQEEKNVLRK